MSAISAPAAEPGSDRGEPFSALVALALVVIGVAAFAAFLVLGAFAPDRERDLRGGSALSDSATGFAALVELLRAEGVPVRVSRAARPPAGGLLVLTPAPGSLPVPPAWLAERGGPILLVLPKWRTAPLAGHPGWVETPGPVDLPRLDGALPASLGLTRREDARDVVLHGGSGLMERLAGAPAGRIDSLQTAAISADWTPVLLDAAGRAVLVRETGHRLYVLTDPDLLDTHGLRDIATARTAVAVVEALRDRGPVTFDVTLDGFGAPPSVLRMLFEPPLLGGTLAAAAAGLLVLIMAANRFGPARQPERVHEFGKRALADNSAGLIALARREPPMAPRYAALVRRLALAALGAPAQLAAEAQDRLLDAASRARGLPDDWSRLARAAAGVRGRADLLAVAARLDRWRREMTRDGR